LPELAGKGAPPNWPEDDPGETVTATAPVLVTYDQNGKEVWLKPTIKKFDIDYNFEPSRRLRFYQFDPLHHDVAIFSIH
jgi:hypothetical protein